MRSSRTSASRFRSSTSVLVTLLALVPGCPSDQECGTGGAPATGLVASATGVTMTFGNITAGANNDCPDAEAPDGVISLTLQGQQTDGAGLFTLCLGRPDRLNSAQALGDNINGVPVRVVDLAGESNNCTLDLDDATPPTGTATGSGACADGTDPAGFALAIDGTVTLTRTCGANVDTVTATLRGRVAISAN